MVVVALALDTPRLSPLVVAWEREPFEPEAAPDEVRSGERENASQDADGVAGKGEKYT